MSKHFQMILALAIVLAMPLMMQSGSLATEVLIYSLAAMACNLLLGYTGLLSFGQGVFFGLGSYTIALAPIRAEGGSVYQMLQQFTAESGGLTGWSDPIYSQRLAESAQQTGSARCALLADCERQLLEGCAVVPLLGQNRRLLVADGITGLVFDPFTPVLDLTDAQKN